jgi:formylglycine-generating enzyme required for sulfatase activity
LLLGGGESATPPSTPEQTAPQPTGGDSQPRRQWAPFAVFTDTTKAGTKGPEMIYIPAGKFRMGDIQGGGEDDEKPVHDVELSAYAIGRTEVTNAQYVEFLNQVGGRGTEKEPWFETKDEDSSSRIVQERLGFKVEDGFEHHPVNNVSWYGSVAYAEWLSRDTGEEYRLPSEAEWERAARAGMNTRWAFRNDEEHLDQYAWYDKNSGRELQVVAKRKPNGWGLYDLYGNLWEWTADWYGSDYYAVSPSDNPKGPLKGSSRVVRGGAWFSSVSTTRSADRNGNPPGDRDEFMGFRLARTVP